MRPSTAAAIIAASPDGIVTLFNAGAERLLGLRASEIEGRAAAHLFFPEAVASERECTWAAKDGRKVRVRLSVIEIPANGSDSGGVLGIATRIGTDDRFERAIRGANDGVFDIDLETGTVYRSDRWLEILGYSRGDLEPAFDVFAQLLHPEDRDRVLGQIQAHLEGTRLRHDEEFRVRARDGSYRWVRGRGLAERDAAGRAVRFSGSITDISDRKALEQQLAEALRQSSEMLRTLVRAAPLAVVSVDRQGCVTSWNPAAERMFGYTEEEVLGRVSPAVPTGQLEEFQTLLDSVVLEGRTSVAVERKRRRKDGSMLDISISIAPLRDSDNRIAGAITVAEDITERKRTERDLRESEERYRRFVDSCPEAIWVKRGAEIIYVNAACRRLFGASRPEDLIGKSPLEFIDPAHRDFLQGEAAARLAAGQTVEARNKIVRLDGETRDVIFTATSIALGGDRAVQAVMRDQTERLVAERKLQDSELRYRRFVEITPDAMFVHKNRYVVFANPAALRLFGAASESELAGKSIFDLYHPDCHGVIRERTRRILEDNETVPPLELRVLRLDGSIVHVEATANRYTDEGELAVQAVLHDLTARRQAMEEMREMSQKLITAQEDEARRIGRELHDDLSQQLAALSIDIGNALATSAPAAALDYLRRLQKRVGRLSEETRQISHRLHPQILDDLGVSDAVESLCIEFEERTRVPVEFEAGEMPETIPPEVASCLYRVAQESLRNVSRHARATSVAVKLDACSEAIELTVKDNGAGFDTASRGSGLGLQSLRERVRLVGGRIAVSSRPGAGTEVYVRVPRHGGLHESESLAG